MSELVTLNQLHRGTNQVFSASSDSPAFNYSDGEQTEKKLYDILSNATDLSSCSDELQQEISDWPTEYHLSPVRANLLRGFDLSGVKRVLELGCGCGAITRYLGELGSELEGEQGLQVDSVEGSPIRAELAALRCRDLDNVTISTANFNGLNFPENYYDLVLFVGVTEYAGRFSDRETDQEALQDLLALARNAMTEQGALIVAIENRTGLKYILGANEDHYARPYIGLDNYPRGNGSGDGIRTYTQAEWDEQLQKAELPCREYLYPFPDYKVPTVVLHQNYVKDNPKAQQQIETIRSRDYTAKFDLAYKESLYWQGVSEAGVIPQLANSLMIVAGKQQQGLSQIASFDYIECPDFKLNMPYCTTERKVGGDVIQEKVDNRVSNLQESTELNHELIISSPVSSSAAVSLNAVWLRGLSNEASDASFKKLLQSYYVFLQNADILTFDYLPSNLNFEMSLQTKQWQHKKSLSVNLLFVRALHDFYLIYPGVVEEKLASMQDWQRLVRYFLYAFHCVGEKCSEADLDLLFQENYEIDIQILRSPIIIDGEKRFTSVVERLRFSSTQDELKVLRTLTQRTLSQRVMQKLRRFITGSNC